MYLRAQSIFARRGRGGRARDLLGEFFSEPLPSPISGPLPRSCFFPRTPTPRCQCPHPPAVLRPAIFRCPRRRAHRYCAAAAVPIPRATTELPRIAARPGFRREWVVADFRLEYTALVRLMVPCEILFSVRGMSTASSAAKRGGDAVRLGPRRGRLARSARRRRRRRRRRRQRRRRRRRRRRSGDSLPRVGLWRGVTYALDYEQRIHLKFDDFMVANNNKDNEGSGSGSGFGFGSAGAAHSKFRAFVFPLPEERSARVVMCTHSPEVVPYLRRLAPPRSAPPVKAAERHAASLLSLSLQCPCRGEWLSTAAEDEHDFAAAAAAAAAAASAAASSGKPLDERLFPHRSAAWRGCSAARPRRAAAAPDAHSPLQGLARLLQRHRRAGPQRKRWRWRWREPDSGSEKRPSGRRHDETLTVRAPGGVLGTPWYRPRRHTAALLAAAAAAAAEPEMAEELLRGPTGRPGKRGVSSGDADSSGGPERWSSLGISVSSGRPSSASGRRS